MIGAIILGLVAGFIAKALLPGDDPGGLLVTIGLGLLGSLVGFFIFTTLLGIGDNKIFDLGEADPVHRPSKPLAALLTQVAPERVLADRVGAVEPVEADLELAAAREAIAWSTHA